MKSIVVALLGLLVASPAPAHEEFRVVGEIAKAQAGKIEVKLRNGNIANVSLDGQTSVTRDKAKVDTKELNPGQFVVIDAYGDDFNDLLALSIQLVPPIAPAK